MIFFGEGDDEVEVLRNMSKDGNPLKTGAGAVS
jgi:hypothetical protein